LGKKARPIYRSRGNRRSGWVRFRPDVTKDSRYAAALKAHRRALARQKKVADKPAGN
jgi:hypothetical protein